MPLPRYVPLLALFLLLAGCHSVADHHARVTALRCKVPYLTRIGYTSSMETVIDADSIRMVSPLPYDRIQSGMVAVFWPINRPTPVCHFVGGRIGTDSWDTHGMNQASDLTIFGYMLTRDNYIGIMR